MCNLDIRQAAKDSGVCLYEIAHCYGMNDGNFSRKLRYELSEEEKTRVLHIIGKLSNEKQKGGK